MTPFETYCQRREGKAISASLPGFYTIEDASAGYGLVALGHDWTRRSFDGDSYRVRDRRSDLARMSLVFVQSRSGNTVADNPATLGGGATDEDLIYERLSRVDADAVLGGAATARSGRRTATALLRDGLISDIYLTRYRLRQESRIRRMTKGRR